MLVLRRNVDPSIKIGDEITVNVLACKGSQERLSVDASRSVAVHREGVAKKIARETAAMTASRN